MLPPLDRDQLNALLAELQALVLIARTRGDEHIPDDHSLPDFWYGVSTGYQDAADRIEAFLSDNKTKGQPPDRPLLWS